jgi:signal transduction histidine kinase
MMLNRHFAQNDAREAILPETRMLAEAAANPDSEAFWGEVKMFHQTGGCAWLATPSGTNAVTEDTSPLPDSMAQLTADALIGYEYLGKANVGGRTNAFAITPVIQEDGTISAAVVAALPVCAGGHPVLCALAALAAGLLAAAGVAVLLVEKLLVPVVRPIAKLRDVAVAVAEGNLTVRASERSPGEIGELGKAINNVSTQLSRSMYSLILERNRLRHMLDGLSEGIVALDEGGHVTLTNPALDRMFTKQRAVHFPDPRMKIIPDETIWEDFDGVIRTGEPLTRNLEVRDMTVRLTIAPTVDELGAIVGAVGLFSDITQMERLERTRREYVSNVSHELRTPLTAMRALVEPLKEGMVTSEADRQRYYDIIMREVMRLSRLINDQLELSRLQSGTIAIQKSKMTIDDLVYDVCDRYNAIAAEHGLELKVLTDFSEFPMVYANEDRVEQMLIILLDNAIKYTEEGSVSVSGTWDDEKVILSVKDTGVGIADEDLPYVFDRFYKVDKAHSGKGSGLGLSIACELLKRMNEEIWVTSEKGKGSEFSFTIHREVKEEEQN